MAVVWAAAAVGSGAHGGGGEDFFFFEGFLGHLAAGTEWSGLAAKSTAAVADWPHIAASFDFDFLLKIILLLKGSSFRLCLYLSDKI